MAVEFGITAENLRPLAIKYYDFRWNEELTKLLQILREEYQIE